LLKNSFKKGIGLNLLIAFLFSLFVFGVYLFSLCPTVYLIDSGELAGVSWTLGIAHPTGYPLYTLISYFFAHLPGEPIKNLNLLSAIFSSIATFFLYITVEKIAKDRFLSLLVTSFFSFSPTIWRISVTNEVYPLTGLFCILILFLFFKLPSSRLFYCFMYLIGLSFTNHISIFSLVLPLFLYILIFFRPSLKQVMLGFIFFLLGVSLYLYLIYRTLGGAELAWGNTCNLQRLFWHITGRQYRVWMFSLSLTEILTNLKIGLSFLARDFLYIFFALILFGFYWLFKNCRRLFWVLGVIFLLNLLYTINYAIPDIEPYYIPGFVSLIFVLTYGLKVLKKFFKWFFTIPVILVLLFIGYYDSTLRNNTFGLEYSYAHISELPSNSLLICNFWDIYSPTIYLRKVKGVRKDLIIIDKELLRRTWYIDYLKREYPIFFKRAEPEINDFLQELYRFEYNRPYDPYKIQSKYVRMLERFVEIEESIGVYFAMPFSDRDLFQVKPDYLRIPSGLNYLVIRDEKNAPSSFSLISFKRPKIVNDPRVKYDIELVKKMISNNIVYFNKTGNIESAEKARLWLRNFIPQF